MSDRGLERERERERILSLSHINPFVKAPKVPRLVYYNGTACRDHPRGVADAFVELYLLAHSDDLLITFATTFGRVASGLGGTHEGRSVCLWACRDKGKRAMGREKGMRETKKERTIKDQDLLQWSNKRPSLENSCQIMKTNHLQTNISKFHMAMLLQNSEGNCFINAIQRKTTNCNVLEVLTFFSL